MLFAEAWHPTVAAFIMDCGDAARCPTNTAADVSSEHSSSRSLRMRTGFSVDPATDDASSARTGGSSGDASATNMVPTSPLGAEPAVVPQTMGLSASVAPLVASRASTSSSASATKKQSLRLVALALSELVHETFVAAEANSMSEVAAGSNPAVAFEMARIDAQEAAEDDEDGATVVSVEQRAAALADVMRTGGAADPDAAATVYSTAMHILSMRLCSSETLLVALTFLHRACAKNFAPCKCSPTSSACSCGACMGCQLSPCDSAGDDSDAESGCSACRSNALSGSVATTARCDGDDDDAATSSPGSTAAASKKARSLSGSSNKSGASSNGLSVASIAQHDVHHQANVHKQHSARRDAADAADETTSKEGRRDGGVSPQPSICVECTCGAMVNATANGARETQCGDELLPLIALRPLHVPGLAYGKRSTASHNARRGREQPNGGELKLTLTATNASLFFTAAVLLAGKIHDDRLCHPRYFAAALRHSNVAALAVAERALLLAMGCRDLLPSPAAVVVALQHVAMKLTQSDAARHGLHALAAAASSSSPVGAASSPAAWTDIELVVPVLLRVFSDIVADVGALAAAVVIASASC